jgi:hypothetical protein
VTTAVGAPSGRSGVRSHAASVSGHLRFKPAS